MRYAGRRTQGRGSRLCSVLGRSRRDPGLASVPTAGAVETPAVFHAVLVCAGPGPVQAFLWGGVDFGGGVHGDIFMYCDQDHRFDMTVIRGPDATRVLGFDSLNAVSDDPMPCVSSGSTWRCSSARNTVIAVILRLP